MDDNTVVVWDRDNAIDQAHLRATLDACDIAHQPAGFERRTQGRYGLCWTSTSIAAPIFRNAVNADDLRFELRSILTHCSSMGSLRNTHFQVNTTPGSGAAAIVAELRAEIRFLFL